jgi:RNA polymerase sigma factor (sigma-70 family)
MARRPPESGVTDEDVLCLREPLSEFVSAWVGPRDSVDEIVQETLTRVLESRSRHEPSALRAYAVAIARNLIISATRAEDVARRHRHQLVDPPTGETPEDAVLRQEEWAALAVAFARLPARDRRMLFAHEVEHEDTAALAESADTSPGAIAAALGRARARLRLEYLLTLRRVDLPTTRCRSVLLSLARRPAPTAAPGCGTAPPQLSGVRGSRPRTRIPPAWALGAAAPRLARRGVPQRPPTRPPTPCSGRDRGHRGSGRGNRSGRRRRRP